MALIGPFEQRRSSAKNLYTFLNDVKKYALEEPRRLYMNYWKVNYNPITGGKDKKDLPACGVIGCIAGNMAILGNKKVDAKYQCFNPRKLLNLFGVGKYSDLRKKFYLLFAGTSGFEHSYGTIGYVKEVNARITKFQKENEKELRSIKIK